MAYLDIDTDELRTLTTTALRTNDSITEAMNLLNQVATHNDWNCPQRDQINTNTLNNRLKAQMIQGNSAAFYSAIKSASDEFDQAEQNLVNRQSGLDDVIGRVASIVEGMGAGGAAEAALNAPNMMYFDNMKDSLEG